MLFSGGGGGDRPVPAPMPMLRVAPDEELRQRAAAAHGVENEEMVVADWKAMPLRILGVIPGAVEGGGGSTRPQGRGRRAKRGGGGGSGAYQLSGAEPLLVVFNRAVIPLGADYGARVPDGLLPFTLDHPFEGRVRWPTTSMVRFDPEGEWPLNVDFALHIKRNTTTHDGAQLGGDARMRFDFATPNTRVTQVRTESVHAHEATAGRWRRHSQSRPVAPPDARVLIDFNCEVDVELACAALHVTGRRGGSKANGKNVPVLCDGLRGGAHHVALRPRARGRHAFWGSAVSREDEDARSVREGPVTTLRVRMANAQEWTKGWEYRLRFAAGARVSALHGPLRDDITHHVMGLPPFELEIRDEFLSEESSRYQRISTRFLAIVFPFGLDAKVTAEHFADVLHVTAAKGGGAELSFEATLKVRNALVLEVPDLLPGKTYHVTVDKSDEITDAFGQPLLGAGMARVRMRDAATVRVLMAEPPVAAEVALASFDKATFSGSVQWLARVANPSMGGKMNTQTIAVNIDTQQMCHWNALKSGLEGWEDFLVKGDESAVGEVTCPTGLCARAAMVVPAAKSLDVEAFALPIEDVITPSNAFALLPFGSTNYGSNHAFRKEVSYESGWAPVVAMVTSVSVVTASYCRPDGSVVLTVWVTAWDDARGVSGARVRQIELGSGRVRKASCVTDAHGACDLAVAGERDGALVLVVEHGEENREVVVSQPPVAWPSRASEEYQGALVVDRGYYRPGDTMHIKGWLRRRHMGMRGGRSAVWWDIDGGASAQLHVYFSGAEAPEVMTVQVHPKFGSLDASVTVPASARYGSVQLLLYATSHQVAATGALIADPRTPTSTMALSCTSPVFQPDGADTTCSVSLATYSEAPIADSRVTVYLDVTMLPPIAEEPREGEEEEEEEDMPDFLRMGGGYAPQVQVEHHQIEVTTDSHGVATFVAQDVLREAGFSGRMHDEDSVAVRAEWLSLTKEVLRESTQLTQAASPWALHVHTPDPAMPALVPSTTVSLCARVESRDSGAPVPNVEEGVEIEVRPLGDADSAPLATCHTQGADGCCFVEWPQVGRLRVSAAVKDEAGVAVEASFVAGMSLRAWAAKPLDELPAVRMAVVQDDAPEDTTVGSTVHLEFVSDYDGARAFVQWGNLMEMRNRTVALSRGHTTVDLVLGHECLARCGVSALVSVPRQSRDSARMAVPVGPLLDVSKPRAFTLRGVINVRDVQPVLDVQVTVDDAVVEPGTSSGFTIKLRDADGRPVAGEAAVFVVDRAVLDVVPHAQTDVRQRFGVDEYTNFFMSESTSSLISAHEMDEAMLLLQEKLNAQPWESLSLTSRGVADPIDTWLQRRVQLLTKGSMAPALRSGVGGHGMRRMKSARVMMRAEAAEADMAMAGGAESAHMPMMMKESYSADEDEDVAEDAGMVNESSHGGGNTPSVTSKETRSHFVETPLAVARVNVDASGEAHYDFVLPDNVGELVVRAWAVTEQHAFGHAETSLTVNKALTLQPSLPRIVRAGDVFDCGVMVAGMGSAAGREVTVTVNADGLNLQSASKTATVQLVGTAPQEVVFSFAARNMGTAKLTFSGVVAGGEDAGAPLSEDLLAVPLPVEGQQDAVVVATSFAVNAGPDGFGGLSNEGVELPDAVDGSGALDVVAGVGHLPAVKALTATAVSTRTGEATVAATVPHAVLSAYDVATEESKSAFAHASKLLSTFTSPEYGLCSSEHCKHVRHPSVWLNAQALYVANQLLARGFSLPSRLTDQWKSSLASALVHATREALKYDQLPSADLVAMGLLALGPHAQFEGAEKRVARELTLERLRERVDSCSLRGSMHVALIYSNWLGVGPDSDRVVANIVERLHNRFYAQGRTAYISAPAPHAASRGDNALALSVFLGAGQHGNPLVGKLANYVAAGHSDAAKRVHRFTGVVTGLGPLDGALCMLALTQYDERVGNVSPALNMQVSSGEEVLLAAEFRSAADTMAQATIPWAQLGHPPQPVRFFVQGRGEASVAMAMTFVPAKVSDDGVYRGIQVSKVVQRVDLATMEPVGPPLSRVRKGMTVQVTVQLTTPDDLDEVVVVDLSAGGVEPMDERARGGDDGWGGSGHTNAQLLRTWMPWMWQWRKETLKDRVRWSSSHVRAGTHTLTYTAMCATSGTFVLPPAHAWVVMQPELMGLSGGDMLDIVQRGDWEAVAGKA